jgi:uncharacterized protein YhbP (UPF0306 family)
MDIDVEKIVREYIDKSIHLSLATVSNSRPWVCEVHFVYDNSLNLYFRSLKSRRHSQEIANNPSVAGDIVKQHEIGEYPHAIYFEGIASILENESERQVIFPHFQERLNANESILDEAKKDDGHQFYKIVVDKWYAFGKFERSYGQKYELDWSNVNQDGQ